MPPLTRGPLPAGVYWRRRVFVLLLAATLVFVIASWLGGGSDGKDDDVPVAQQAGGEQQASQTVTVSERKGRKGRRDPVVSQGPTYDPTVMAEPEGNCEPADVRVTPHVTEAVAGRPVTIGLSLQTVQADACYFRIGPDKISVKVTRGGKEVWTSRECPDPVPDDSVVVRRAVATEVEMQWTPYPVGSRHGQECPGTKDWLLPDDFTVTAAVLGGEPGSTAFDLASPTPETVTVTPHPERDRSGKRDRDAAQADDQNGANGATEQPSDRSTDEPRR